MNMKSLAISSGVGL